ncbi:protein CLN8 [Biomphalaria glabrata]|nr:protein CLN8-like [Biomphalaria glabrata]
MVRSYFWKLVCQQVSLESGALKLKRERAYLRTKKFTPSNLKPTMNTSSLIDTSSAEVTRVIPEEEILQYLCPSLLKLDYTSRKVKAEVVLAAFTFVSFIFLITLAICNAFPAFRALVFKHKVFMCLAVVRGVYGFFGLIVGVYAIFKTTNLDRDVVFGTTATSAFAMCVSVGFFLFEILAVVISDIAFGTFSRMLIMHHSLALTAYSLAIYYEANYSYGSKGMILEMSTPFSCLCYVLLKAGMENSRSWFVNQMVLVHTFHLRSVVECYLWYVTYQNWGNIWHHMPVPLLTLLYANLVLVTFLMTPYWGYKKTQQLFNPVDWNFQETKNTDKLASKKE